MADAADEVKPNSQGAMPEDIAQQPGGHSPAPAPAASVKPEGAAGDGVVPKPKEQEKPAEPPAQAADEGNHDTGKDADKPKLDDQADKAAPAEWVKLEDPSGQAAIDLLKEGGVTPAEAELIFGDAMQTGDMSKVKWDVLESRLGKAKAHLVKTGVIDYNDRVAKATRETTAKVFDIVGGKENWTKVADWVAKVKKADPSSKAKFDSIQAGLDAGGYTAELVAKELRAMYEADPTNNGLGTDKIVHGNKPDATAGGPIDKKTYQTEIKKAYAEGDQKLINSLRARRLAGQKAGL